jgi:hypothetical protein
MTQVANAALPPPTNVPTGLMPDVTANEVFLVGHGKGVQIYKCLSGTNGTFSWVFQAPRATLTGDHGQVVATHGAGPIWTAPAPDTSSVTGSNPVKDPPGVLPPDAKNIQQLLLNGTPSGTGVFSGTTFIQRLNTKGGTQPPTAECKAQTADKVVEVPYQADYYFWKATDKPGA